jgi:hypothetical protein
MRIVRLATNFTSGELDPLLRGRSDLEQYQNGLERAKNVMVQPQGGVRRRDGLRYVGDFTGFTAFKMIPFEFSTTDSYLLVLVAGRIYVYKAGVRQTNINGSGNDYITATGLTAAMLDELDYTQAVDTLIICHEDLQTKRLVRNSDTSWTWENVPFVTIPKFAFTLTVTEPASEITPSGISGNIELVAQHSIFSAGSVGNYVQAKNGFGRARLVQYVNATTMKAVTEVPFFDTSKLNAGDWELESGYEDAWSAARGWPRSATFHQNRLYFGGSKSRTNTIWGSRVINYFDFDPGTGLDDEGVEATIATNQYNAITRIASQSDLRIFSTGGEFIVTNSEGQPITPATLLVRPQTRLGVKAGVPIEDLNGASIFVQRNGKSINAFQYTDRTASYQITPISVLSSHLIKNPVDLAVRRGTSTDETDSLYVVNGEDGSMTVYSVLASQGVIAASEFTTGINEGDEFIAVAAELDQVYVIVKRTINATTKYYLERFDQDALLDSSLYATVGSATSSAAVDHLPNTLVWVRADGLVQAQRTVPSSSPYTVSISPAADEDYEIGIDIPVEIRTMPQEPNLPTGSSLGVQKRVLQVDALVKDSQHMNINGHLVSFQIIGTAVLNNPIPSFTGRKTIHGLLGYTDEGKITVTQSYPLKLNLIAMEYRLSLGD